MQKVVMMGFNSNTRKLTPWQPHLAKMPHITQVQAAYDTETKKFKVIRKVNEQGGDDTVKAEITAADIQADLAAQEQAKLAQAAADQALLSRVQNDTGPSVDDMNKEVEKPATKFAKPEPAAELPKVGL